MRWTGSSFWWRDRYICMYERTTEQDQQLYGPCTATALCVDALIPRFPARQLFIDNRAVRARDSTCSSALLGEGVTRRARWDIADTANPSRYFTTLHDHSEARAQSQRSAGSCYPYPSPGIVGVRLRYETAFCSISISAPRPQHQAFTPTSKDIYRHEDVKGHLQEKSTAGKNETPTELRP